MTTIDITKYKGLVSNIPQPGEDYFKIVFACFFPAGKDGFGDNNRIDPELEKLIAEAHLDKHEIYKHIGEAPRPMQEMLFNKLDDQFMKNKMAYDIGLTMVRFKINPSTHKKIGTLQVDAKLQALFDYIKDNYYNMNIVVE